VAVTEAARGEAIVVAARARTESLENVLGSGMRLYGNEGAETKRPFKEYGTSLYPIPQLIHNTPLLGRTL